VPAASGSHRGRVSDTLVATAEQAHALMDSGQAHAAPPCRAEQRCLDVKAATVVDHLRADAVLGEGDLDANVGDAGAVLANVVERLADDAEQRDAL
jgi:hypothetical protein